MAKRFVLGSLLALSGVFFLPSVVSAAYVFESATGTGSYTTIGYGIRDDSSPWSRFTKSGFHWVPSSDYTFRSVWLYVGTNFASEDFPQEDEFYVAIENTSTTTYESVLVDLSAKETLQATSSGYWVQFSFTDDVTLQSGQDYLFWLKPLDYDAEHWYYGIGYASTSDHTANGSAFAFDFDSDAWQDHGGLGNASNYKKFTPVFRLDDESGTVFDLTIGISFPDFTQVNGDACDWTTASAHKLICYSETFLPSWSFRGTTTDTATFDRDITTYVRSFDNTRQETNETFVYINSDMYFGAQSWGDTVTEYGSSLSGLSTNIQACAYDPDAVTLAASTTLPATINNAACITIFLGNGMASTTARSAGDQLGIDGPDITYGEREPASGEDSCGLQYGEDWVVCKIFSTITNALTLWPLGYVTEPVIGYYEFKSGRSTTSTSSHFVLSLDVSSFDSDTAYDPTIPAPDVPIYWDINAFMSSAYTLSPELFDTIDLFLWAMFWIYIAYRMWSGVWYGGAEQQDAYDRQRYSREMSVRSMSSQARANYVNARRR